MFVFIHFCNKTFFSYRRYVYYEVTIRNMNIFKRGIILKKPKSGLKKIGLVIVTTRFVPKKRAYEIKNVKIGWKMTELCQITVLPQKWHLTYFVPIDGHFSHIFWDMNFKFVLPYIYINFDIQTKFEVNQTQFQKTHQSGHISKPHFAQMSFTKKPTPPTFSNEFVWNVQNQCKYGFCTY